MKNNTTYCVVCCDETTHKDNGNNEYICTECSNSVSEGIVDRDEQIENLAYENKMMAEFLTSLGYTQEQIGNVCTGGKETAPELFTPYIKELEDTENTSFVKDGTLVHVFNSEMNEGYSVHLFNIDEVAMHSDADFVVNVGLCTGSAEDAINFLI